jgi:hypothetical protein
VHILAKGKRYEAANYLNATIPTNLNIDEKGRERFGELYAALFDAMVEKTGGGVITEYSWDASSCDPCPVPALRPNELATLGADVVLKADKEEKDDSVPQLAPSPSPVTRKPGQPAPRRRRPPRRWRRRSWSGWVLTRLHVRYDKNALGEDLRFREAPAIVGGREFLHTRGKLEEGARQGSRNNFQARYAIRHPWKGPITCDEPRFGIWGGPPSGEKKAGTMSALNLAFAKRGAVKLASYVRQDVPELNIETSNPLPKPGDKDPGAKVDTPKPSSDSDDDGDSDDGASAKKKGGACGCELPGAPAGGAAALWLAALAAVVATSRRRRPHG